MIKNNIVTGYIIQSQHFRTPPIIQVNGDFLKDWQFYKVKDAFTANQEIANYIGGVLPANANPMVELENLDKVRKAGFDVKTSFRKGKTKHKKRNEGN